jgi:hypothetical protein
MHPVPPPPPPVSAEFESSAGPAQAGGPPQKIPWKMSRCSNGKTVIDQGGRSVITDPQAGQMTILDHVKKEAMILPLKPPAPGSPGAGMSGAPGQSMPAPLSIQDLGKKIVGGNEVEGKLLKFAPPKLPQIPGAPRLPGQPEPPGGPKPPGSAPPGGPQFNAPSIPHTLEVWTSTKFQLPLFSKSTSNAGSQTVICKQVTPGDSAGCSTSIPPGYRVVPLPKLPEAPKPPG